MAKNRAEMSQRLDKNQPWHKHAFAKERKFRATVLTVSWSAHVRRVAYKMWSLKGLKNFGGLNGYSMATVAVSCFSRIKHIPSWK